MHPDDRPAFVRAHDALATGVSRDYAVEYRIARGDGAGWAHVRSVGTVVDPVATEATAREPEPARRAAGVILDVTARAAAEQARAASDARWRALVEHSDELIAILDADGTNRYASPAHERVLGLAPAALVGTSCFRHVHPDDVEGLRAHFARAIAAAGPTAPALIRFHHRDGEVRTLAVTFTDLRADPAIGGLVANSRDRTAELLAEAQLRQAQKMEAIGQLAAGIAHDFNNLLTAISGNVELALHELALHELALHELARHARTAHPGQAAAHPTPDARLAGNAAATTTRPAFLREVLEDAQEAARRAARVTRQLLTFGRKQVLQPQAVTLAAVVRSGLPLVRRVVGAPIELVAHLTDGGSTLVLDPTQITQVLLNLVANARDAMRQGGERDRPSRLTLITTEVEVIYPGTPGAVLPGPSGRVDHVAAAVISGQLLPRHGGAAAGGLSESGLSESGMSESGLVSAEERRGNVTPRAVCAPGLAPELASELVRGPVPDRPGLAPGRYSVLAVVDTGVGFDAQTQSRLFEPFFTTKAPGEGTGLGLATSYGIVRQSRGRLYADSVPGVGTAFLVYLPVPDLAETPHLVVAPAIEPPSGGTPAAGAAAAGMPVPPMAEERPDAPTLTLLVAEDDAMVRRVVRRVVLARGWELLEAADGDEALALWEMRRRVGRPIHALLTDVVMPRLSGGALARRLLHDRPDLPVLLMTGYAEVVPGAGLPPSVPWIEKPFGSGDLLTALDQLLGDRDRHG